MNAIAVNEWIYSVGFVSSKAKAVYLNLAYRSNRENTCFPGLKRIACECGISVSSVQRAVRELQEIGILKKETRFRSDRGQTSNLYILASNIVEVLESHKKRLEEKMEQIEMERSIEMPEEKQAEAADREPDEEKRNLLEEKIEQVEMKGSIEMPEEEQTEAADREPDEEKRNLLEEKTEEVEVKESIEVPEEVADQKSGRKKMNWLEYKIKKTFLEMQLFMVKKSQDLLIKTIKR